MFWISYTNEEYYFNRIPLHGENIYRGKTFRKAWPALFDTDDLIVEQAGMPISKIVEEGGWDLFAGKKKKRSEDSHR